MKGSRFLAVSIIFVMLFVVGCRMKRSAPPSASAVAQKDKIKPEWDKETWINVDKLARPLPYATSREIVYFLDAIHRFGGNEREVVKQLGAPIIREADENFSKLYYDGLLATNYRDENHDYINFLAVKDARWDVPMGLSIGSSREDVTAVLGDSPLIQDDAYVYPFDLLVTDGFVIFYFHGDKVAKITWDYGIQ